MLKLCWCGRKQKTLKWRREIQGTWTLEPTAWRKPTWEGCADRNQLMGPCVSEKSAFVLSHWHFGVYLLPQLSLIYPDEHISTWLSTEKPSPPELHVKIQEKCFTIVSYVKNVSPQLYEGWARTMKNYFCTDFHEEKSSPIWALRKICVFLGKNKTKQNKNPSSIWRIISTTRIVFEQPKLMTGFISVVSCKRNWTPRLQKL